ncbi:hypothetical protein [Nocardioides sp. TF02-7]|uniref:hypothetical protein n=1 Tax=Nocardioides sp. TF02-7 TaxID=2917724 RepID=UPI001F068BB6|nr:hypothetical protein [Nocardioides sp. TF02-7]UMG94595.1 hypothetical protein MF408_11955 [Nocardioides sp. TF02-7]
MPSRLLVRASAAVVAGAVAATLSSCSSDDPRDDARVLEVAWTSDVEGWSSDRTPWAANEELWIHPGLEPRRPPGGRPRRRQPGVDPAGRRGVCTLRDQPGRPGRRADGGRLRVRVRRRHRDR